MDVDELVEQKIGSWQDISRVLNELTTAGGTSEGADATDFSKGIGFITYDYGIDGVSIEIYKYAICLERLLSTDDQKIPIHFIGGDFTEKADTVLLPHWHRFELEGSNGWAKWDDGKWFGRLFYEDMPDGSDAAAEMATEIWNQAVAFACTLVAYITDNELQLFIPVNVSSNPGNLATALSVVLATEATGVAILNSNHDFFWEGGKPAEEHAAGEDPGVRDHFFHNYDNKPFFEVFERILPWNGKRWLQVNINSRQSDTLVNRYGFDRNRVSEVGTAIDDAFFEVITPEQRRSKRVTMAHILSDGKPLITPVAVSAHLDHLLRWMKKQTPVVCGGREGLELDLASDALIYLLQPTRIIERKRIERDWELVGALLGYQPFLEAFNAVPDRKLVVHITGPVPIEHQEDLERVIEAYRAVLGAVPADLADRLFMAFSVGNEDHESLEGAGLDRLYIQDIYKLADAVVFPSETEGRGLPIVESSAGAVPIICSRYQPEEVFAEVVGEHLPPERQIQYTLFPEDGYSDEMLQKVTDLLFSPESFEARFEHNRAAVSGRYGMQALQSTFQRLLDQLAK